MTRADEVPQRRKPPTLRVRAEAAEIGQLTLRQNGIFRAAEVRIVRGYCAEGIVVAHPRMGQSPCRARMTAARVPLNASAERLPLARSGAGATASESLIGDATHAELGGPTMGAADSFDGKTLADTAANGESSRTLGPRSPGSDPAEATLRDEGCDLPTLPDEAPSEATLAASDLAGFILRDEPRTTAKSSSPAGNVIGEGFART